MSKESKRQKERRATADVAMRLSDALRDRLMKDIKETVLEYAKEIEGASSDDGVRCAAISTSIITSLYGALVESTLMGAELGPSCDRVLHEGLNRMKGIQELIEDAAVKAESERN